MKKITLIIVIVALLACMPGTGLASQGTQSVSPAVDVSPMYAYINYAACGLDINPYGLASMAVSIDCNSYVNKIYMSIYLQKYNSVWQTVNHWTQYTYSDYATWTNSYYVMSGYQYRLYVYYYVYHGDTYLEGTTCASYDSY